MMKDLRCARIGLLFVFFTLLFNDVFAQTFIAKPGVQSSENSFGYYEYLPEGYDPGSKETYPLLIFVHGLGELGDGVANLSKVLVNGPPKLMNNRTFPKSFTVKGQTLRFIAIMPQFKIWPDGDELNQTIDFAIRNYKIDAGRVYLTGLSMGGGVVWYYAGLNVANSERIAAIVPVCGAGYPAAFRYENMAEANLPVWATHNVGDGDVPVSYTNGFVDGMNSYKVPPIPKAKKTIFPVSGHDAWTKTYDPNFKEDGMNVYEWMLQYTRGSASRPLAVSEVKFTANESQGNVMLRWTTAGELDNRGFAIERSSNGLAFDSIGYVASLGGASGSYSFEDHPLSAGSSFYRLKIIATNGAVTYSKVLSIEVRRNNAVSIFPNPVQSTLNLNTDHNLQNAKLRIFDMTGKLVLEKIISGSGNHALRLALPAAIYSLSLSENGVIIFKQSFVKQ